MTRVLGVDTGSRWCGSVALEPGIVFAAGTHDVNPLGVKPHAIDVAPTVAWILGCAAISGAEVIVVEHSEQWASWPGMSPGAQMATQANWVVCDRIVRDLQRLSPIPVATIHVQAWRARVLPRVPRRPKGEPASVVDPSVRKKTRDRAVAEALASAFPPESVAILSTVCAPCTTATHQRDAAGAACGWLLRAFAPPVAKEALAPAKPQATRGPPVPAVEGERRVSRAAAYARRKAAERRSEKEARGCSCKGRHRRECSAFVTGRTRRTKNNQAADPYDAILFGPKRRRRLTCTY